MRKLPANTQSLCIIIYLYIYICICVCIYIYISIQVVWGRALRWSRRLCLHVKKKWGKSGPVTWWTQPEHMQLHVEYETYTMPSFFWFKGRTLLETVDRPGFHFKRLWTISGICLSKSNDPWRWSHWTLPSYSSICIKMWRNHYDCCQGSFSVFALW